MAERELLPQETAHKQIVRRVEHSAVETRPRATGTFGTRTLLRLQRDAGNWTVNRLLMLARQAEGEGQIAPEVEQAIQTARGGGQALDSAVRVQMEPALGADFGGVRVHTGGQADALNRSLSARAFTTGQDIFFKQGEYSPGSSGGRELLAHELTHVVQQNEGVRRAKAPDEEPEEDTGGKMLAKFETVQRGKAPDEEPEEETGGKMLAKPIQAKLTVGAADDPYEQEADQMASSVMRQEQQASQQEAVQRQSEPDEEEKKRSMQAKMDQSQVQRQAEVRRYIT